MNMPNAMESVNIEHYCAIDNIDDLEMAFSEGYVIAAIYSTDMFTGFKVFDDDHLIEDGHSEPVYEPCSEPITRLIFSASDLLDVVERYPDAEFKTVPRPERRPREGRKISLADLRKVGGKPKRVMAFEWVQAVADPAPKEKPFVDKRQPEITVLTKSDGPLTKHITLADDGTLKSDGSGCRLVTGKARRQPVSDVTQLAALIGSLRSDQAIALGTLRSDVDSNTAVTTKRRLGDSAAIARTSEYISYPDRRGYVLLDYDTKGMPFDVRERIKAAGGFWSALVGVVPEFANIARVDRASTSAGIKREDTDQPIAGSDGIHVYIEVQSITDSVRFLKTLHQRCWLAGFGWYMIGRGGQFLERSIVDRMVGAPERLCFEGAPTLGDGLAQNAEARRPRATRGEPLDTTAACVPLTRAEEGQLTAAQSKAKQALAPASAKAREKFINEEAQKIINRTGLVKNAAVEIVKKQRDGTLLPDFVLTFDDPDLEGKTVADVMADPAAFEGETLADPIEGVDYGRCKAMIMRRYDGTPWIHSFAHGRTVYELRYDADAVRAAIDREIDPRGVLPTLMKMLLQASVSEPEEHSLIDIAAKRTASTIARIAKEIKKVRAAKAEEDRHEARERRLAERTDRRPLMKLPPKDGELTPVMAVLNGVLGKIDDPNPPCRNMEGHLSRAKKTVIPELHPFASANEDAGAVGESAPQWRIHAMSESEITELIERHIEFEAGDHAARLQSPYVAAYTRRDDGVLPTLAAVISLPIVSADGKIMCASGLDRERGIYYDPDMTEFAKEIVPGREKCDQQTVGDAWRFLTEEWLGDVATDLDGKCVLLSYAMSILERSLLDVRPAYFVTAGRRGSGKTTVLQMVVGVVTGAPVSAAAWTTVVEERRKGLHSYLMAGVASLLYDNIPRGMQIACPHIEAALTSKYYEDRKLGVSEVVRTSAATIIAFTGNNIGPKGDMVSRSLIARLDANRLDPENRDFRHPDPLAWTQEHRPKILRALYTIILGNPALDLPRDAPMKTRFKFWQRLVGSAIEHATKCAKWTDPDGCELPAWDELTPAVDFAKLFVDGEEEDEDSADLGEVLLALERKIKSDRLHALTAAAITEFVTGGEMTLSGTPEHTDAFVIRDFLFPQWPPGKPIAAKLVSKRLKKHTNNPVPIAGRVLKLASYLDDHAKVTCYYVEDITPK